MFKMKECYTKYINLDHRIDRNDHMQQLLKNNNIKAERFRAYYPQECIVDKKISDKMLNSGFPGKLGCFYSHIKLLEEIQKSNKNGFILEDDLIFCSDFDERIKNIEDFLNTHTWDIFWLCSTVHINPTVWHTGNHPECKDSNVRVDAEPTDNKRIMRTYGCFTTSAYFVNKNSISKIIELTNTYADKLDAIDKIFVNIQPLLHTYGYLPGCVKQLDNHSDIIMSHQNFSYFNCLGPYWWQDKKENFDPKLIIWPKK